MHLRRALLLFAIVLGLAAVVASLSRTDRNGPPERRPERPNALPQARGQNTPTAQVGFHVGGKRELGRLRRGRSAVVTVGVEEPGQVDIRGLGLTAPASPGTPARFDVFETEPGRFPVSFRPAGAVEPRRVGVLAVER